MFGRRPEGLRWPLALVIVVAAVALPAPALAATVILLEEPISRVA